MHDLLENLGQVTGSYEENNPDRVLSAHNLFEKFMYSWNSVFLCGQMYHQTIALVNPKSDE
jgi:hypothetical protein